jgi:hypothetical protein
MAAPSFTIFLLSISDSSSEFRSFAFLAAKSLYRPQALDQAVIL